MTAPAVAYIFNRDDNNAFTDIRECLSNPCVHGQCVEDHDGYQCVCTPGYSGVNCEFGKLPMPSYCLLITSLLS